VPRTKLMKEGAVGGGESLLNREVTGPVDARNGRPRRTRKGELDMSIMGGIYAMTGLEKRKTEGR